MTTIIVNVSKVIFIKRNRVSIFGWFPFSDTIHNHFQWLSVNYVFVINFLFHSESSRHLRGRSPLDLCYRLVVNFWWVVMLCSALHLISAEERERERQSDRELIILLSVCLCLWIYGSSGFDWYDIQWFITVVWLSRGSANYCEVWVE